MTIQTPPKRSRSWLVGTALGVLIALLIAPTTRWLVTSQLALIVPLRSSVAPYYSDLGLKYVESDEAYAQRAMHKVAVRHPEDLQIQLADAVTAPPAKGTLDSLQKVQRLEALTARFPDSPSIYANLLRYMSQGDVSVHRDEGNLVEGYPIHKRTGSAGSSGNTPEQLAAYDNAAATGEQLDPGNAYFSLMRAIGLFAAHRDAEALDALHRAAEKTRWQEYYTDELEGTWRLQEEAFGYHGALPRNFAAMAILFPQYAQMRGAARMAIYEAMEAELAGHPEEGFSIRRDLMRCGSLMRAQCPSVLGSLVGIAVTRIAMARPDGAAPIRSSGNVQKQAQYNAQRLNEYTAYLSRIGHADEIAQVRAEDAAGDRVRSLARKEGEAALFNPIQRLILWWLIDLLTVYNVLWLLLLGSAAALLANHPRIRAGQGLPGYARWSVVVGLIAGLLAAPALLANCTSLFSQIAHRDRYLLAGLLLGIPLLCLPVQQARDRLRRLGVFTLSMIVMILLVWLYAWPVRGAMPYTWYYCNFFLADSEEGGLSNVLGWPILLTGLTPIVSLLAFVTLAVVSRACRVPLSVGLARGFKGIAVPLSCALLLIYGGLALFTLRAEAVTQYGLTRTVQGEGRYMAELAGQPWPK